MVAQIDVIQLQPLCSINICGNLQDFCKTFLDDVLLTEESTEYSVWGLLLCGSTLTSRPTVRSIANFLAIMLAPKLSFNLETKWADSSVLSNLVSRDYNIS